MDNYYNVAFSYDYTTVSVGVMATDEIVAETLALDIAVNEWGKGIEDYSSCDIELLFSVDKDGNATYV